MPDDIATKEDDGYVQVKLDAPNGAELMQPLPNDTSELPQPTAHYQNISPMPQQSGEQQNGSQGVQQSPAHTESAASPVLSRLQSLDQPQEVINISQHLQEAQSKEAEAKTQAETALKDIKQLEEQARADQEELEKQVKQAKDKLQEAESALKDARNKQKEGQKQFDTIQKEKGTDNKKVAGYKVTQLLTAFTKPPQPDMGLSSNNSPVDDKVEKQLKSQVKETDKQLSQTEKQVSAASKQADKAAQTAKKFKERLQGFIDTVSKLLQKLNGEDKASGGGSSYRPFLIIGLVLFVLAAVSMIISPSAIWALVAAAAIVQLAMGSFLKTKAQ